MSARGVKLDIPLPASFSFDGVVRSHGWYDLPPFHYEAGSHVLETVVAVGGAARPVRFESSGAALTVSASGISRGVLTRIATRVFSLDLDLSLFASSLPAGGPLARALSRGGGRMLRSPSLFEDAVKMLFTTNCSWAATKGMVIRLIALAGAEGLAFPDAADVAKFSAARLERDVRCGYRGVALARLARRVASGKLDLSRWEDPSRPAAEVRDEILAERGFGPYAAEGLLRILGRHDFLALDSWTRQKYRKMYPGPVKKTDGSIARRYARFGAHRGLAMWLDLTRDWHEGEKVEVWP
ncbi:MAG TPA: Fe-S cluster assembly protein HesB [Thermoanaerobaculia bacterium]|nr:Fe-S cluster assembly protein HesB [Thermoanaerobaculia bacterium]